MPTRRDRRGVAAQGKTWKAFRGSLPRPYTMAERSESKRSKDAERCENRKKLPRKAAVGREKKIGRVFGIRYRTIEHLSS